MKITDIEKMIALLRKHADALDEAGKPDQSASVRKEIEDHQRQLREMRKLS